jgi:hypothetical protein
MFSLSSVRLLEGPFTPAVAANREYLLALDPDRLLAPIVREAGLEPRKPVYGNWEGSGLDGHTAGHYLSALANMIASGDDTKDGELGRRLDYMLSELARCQKVNGDETTQSGIHEGRRWRDGKWFQYTLNTHGETAVDLVVSYWGGDTGRAFDILINGKLLSTQVLNGEKPGSFIEKRYSISTDMLPVGSGRITIKFIAKEWVAGGVFDLRLMRTAVAAYR